MARAMSPDDMVVVVVDELMSYNGWLMVDGGG